MTSIQQHRFSTHWLPVGARQASVRVAWLHVFLATLLHVHSFMYWHGTLHLHKSQPPANFF
jgi:hypothetical protein